MGRNPDDRDDDGWSLVAVNAVMLAHHKINGPLHCSLGIVNALRRWLALVVLVAGIFGVTVSTTAKAQSATGPYFAYVTRIKDGDTFEARVIVWPNVEITASVRLRNIDTPELFKPRCKAEKAEAIKAKAALDRIVRRTNHRFPDVDTPIVVLRNINHDSFGRALADVSKNNGRIATILLRQGHHHDDVYLESTKSYTSPFCVYLHQGPDYL